MRSIANTLAAASADARQAALARVIGDLRDDEVTDLRRLARATGDKRRRAMTVAFAAVVAPASTCPAVRS